jgi:hypothetical protein
MTEIINWCGWPMFNIGDIVYYNKTEDVCVVTHIMDFIPIINENPYSIESLHNTEEYDVALWESALSCAMQYNAPRLERRKISYNVKECDIVLHFIEDTNNESN